MQGAASSSTAILLLLASVISVGGCSRKEVGPCPASPYSDCAQTGDTLTVSVRYGEASNPVMTTHAIRCGPCGGTELGTMDCLWTYSHTSLVEPSSCAVWQTKWPGLSCPPPGQTGVSWSAWKWNEGGRQAVDHGDFIMYFPRPSQ